MRELKASLILDKVAEKEKIFVTENEVEQRIAELARSYNTDTARVRKQLERQGSLSYLRNEMREGKVINLLLERSQNNGRIRRVPIKSKGEAIKEFSCIRNIYHIWKMASFHR